MLIGDDFFTPQYLDYDVSIVRKTLDASIIDIIDILGKFDDVLYLQFSRYLRVYERLRELYSVCLDPLSKETFIVTARMQEEDIFLEMSYLHPGKYLETHLWNDLDTCLLTSATLQINESFDYIK
ncbi:MAG: hypothetical protein H6767_06450 [Candidatus Peribacteria bacterium]|nr:MAG: hypothetical protein H6767_06450 [Candidatus Peribacteria bacterium]